MVDDNVKKERAERGGEASAIWREIRERISDFSDEASTEMTEEELMDLWYRRALELSRVPEHEKEQGRHLKTITFRLGSDRYGVGLEMVREIHRAEGITPVPTAPDFVVGVVNLRGNILSVVDIRSFFGLPETRQSPKSRILVVEGSGLRVGILVERIEEIADVNAADIKPPLSVDKGIAEDYIKGILRHKSEMIILVDLEKILNNPRLVVEENV